MSRGILSRLEGKPENGDYDGKLRGEGDQHSGVCQMYGIGKATVERAIRKGHLRVSRVGRRVVIRIVDAEKWIGASRGRKRS
jgi:excisionase family DNA binding protein